MGLELFISWQAIVLAAIVVTVTGGVKKLLCMAWPKCKETKIGSTIILPMLPLVLASIAGAVIPLRPDEVTEYVAEHTHGVTTVIAYAAWGFVAAGILGAWIFDRVKAFLTHGKDEA